jgi:hypothetical protein
MDAFGPLRGRLARRVDVDVARIERAFTVAKRWHRGQSRRSGDPYITHPVAVASIVADLEADTDVICAALLHDLLEDTPYTRNQLQAEFGTLVTALVEGIADLDKPEQVTALQQHWFEGSDVNPATHSGVLMIKIADRLHNMRTIRYLRWPRQVYKSNQTLEIVAPLAHRLGFHAIQQELEDLALEVLRPAPKNAGAAATLVTLAAGILPARARARWIEEWAGELLSIQSRRRRTGFALGVILFSLPRLAISLRQIQNPTKRGALSTMLIRATGPLAAGATMMSTGIPSKLMLWTAGTAVIGALGLLTAVLFTRSETAVRRLAALIRAWRQR